MAASDNQDNIINYAGDFRLKTCNIISYRKSSNSEKALRFNMAPQCMAISFVESVTTPFITGSLDITDGQDIRTLLPITGNERLELRCFTPGQREINFTEDTTGTLNIYKIDKIRITGGTGRTQLYRVHFISREAYRNNLIKISKAYAGPVENAVYEIVQDEKYLDSRKPLFVEPTSTNAKYVIPNLKPLSTINFLGNNAISGKYKNAGYLFYETSKGFHFRSFESLMAMNGIMARPVVENYEMQPANIRTGGEIDVIRNLRAPDSYSFENAVNTLDEINKGMIANRLVTHDIYEKKIETFDYDYHDEFQNHFHTEHTGGGKSTDKFTTPLMYFEDTSKTLSDFPMAKLMHMVNQKKVHNDYEFTPIKDILPNKISQRGQMSNLHLLLSVPGQTRMNAGDMIVFALPDQRPVAHDQAQDLTPYYGGRYLILSLKHKFDVVNNKHTMNLRCVKDAVRLKLPEGLDEIVKLPSKTEAINVYDDDERKGASQGKNIHG